MLPDHLLLPSQDRTRDPSCLYPGLQEIEAWEPNDHPHDNEVIAPSIGGRRAGQDFSVDTKCVIVISITQTDRMLFCLRNLVIRHFEADNTAKRKAKWPIF